ncbi:MAG: B12-binding domain-containing radical SAM protein [Elusimicrobia bacterium]|nr:B12-binding domain-containing radical SAM protein [Elusimicrobiota bacterium]
MSYAHLVDASQAKTADRSAFRPTPLSLWPVPRTRPVRVFLTTVPYDNMKLGYGIDKKNEKGKVYGYTPPLGLGMLARVAKDYGCEVVVNDAGALGDDYDGLIAKIAAFKPDMVGFSVFTANFMQAMESVERVRLHPQLKDALVLIGGPHVYTFREKVLTEIPADIAVYGEAEADLLELLEFYDKKRAGLAKVNGVFYRTEAGILKTEEEHSSRSLDNFGFPDWDQFDFSLYRNMPGQVRRHPMTSMVTSRGCPYRCNFCFQAGRFADKYRRYSPEVVIAEIQKLQARYGIKEIQFWDDIFFINKKWVETFCHLIKKNRIDLTWSGYARVDLVDPDLLKLARESGCWNIFYGFEVGTQEMLDFLDKRATLKQAVDACRWTKEAGIIVRGSFMVGLPNETPEIGRKTIDFALELDPDYANFNIFFPEPGTGLYELALKSGRLLSHSYLGRGVPVYLPEGYDSPEAVRKVQAEAFRRFYFRPSYLAKRVMRVRTLSEVRQYWDGLRMLLSMGRTKVKYAFATEAAKTGQESRNVF